MMSQDEFIERLNRKDVAAYEELFRRYYRYLVVCACRLVGREDVAEDVVPEVVVALWEGAKVFDSYRGFQAFVYNAVKNGCLNWLKREEMEARHQRRMVEEGEVRESDEGEEEYAVAREELYRRLHEAVERLPERCRAVFRLRMEGMRNEEIAGRLRLSVETVKTQNKKALAFLREELGRTFSILAMLGMIEL